MSLHSGQKHHVDLTFSLVWGRFFPTRVLRPRIEECVKLSKRFGKLLSEDLDVPVYMYAESQPLKYRAELPSIRKGGVNRLRLAFSVAILKRRGF